MSQSNCSILFKAIIKLFITLQIVATDDGTPPLSTTATFTLYVTDAAEDGPQFNDTFYNWEIYYDADVASEVGVVVGYSDGIYISLVTKYSNAAIFCIFFYCILKRKFKVEQLNLIIVINIVLHCHKSCLLLLQKENFHDCRRQQKSHQYTLGKLLFLIDFNSNIYIYNISNGLN